MRLNDFNELRDRCESSLLHQPFRPCRDFPEAAPTARVLRAFCTGVESLRLSTFGSRADLAVLSLCPKITFPRKETGSTDEGLFRRPVSAAPRCAARMRTIRPV